MDNNGVSIFENGHDLQIIQEEDEDTEFDQEVNRRRGEELKKELEHGFDDLSSDEESDEENSKLHFGSVAHNQSDASFNSGDNARNSVMDTNGLTITDLDLQIIHEVEEDESYQEVDRRQDGLTKQLERVYDDLSLGGDCNEENSNLSSGNDALRSREAFLIDEDNARNSMHGNHSEGASDLLEEYINNRANLPNIQQTSVWGDASDHSGNFVLQESMIKSPTRFPLNMKNVVSNSEYSGSDTENDVQHEVIEHEMEQNFSYNDNRIRRTCNRTDYISAETSYDQLKLLYEERGRELDKLCDEMNKLKNITSKEKLSLTRELAVIKNENQIYQINNNKVEILLEDAEKRLRSLSDDLDERDKQCQMLERENKNLKMKITLDEGTISNLERHVTDLESIDSIAKSRQVHDNFLRKLRSSHDEEVEVLKRKLKMEYGKKEEYDQELKSLQDDLTTARKAKEISLKEKDEIIQQLNANLDAAKRQIQSLLKSNSKDTSEEDGSILELKERLKIAETEIEHHKSELDHYHVLEKLGLFQYINSSEDTGVQLSFRKELKFDESNNSKSSGPSASTGDLEIINGKLKTELLYNLNQNRNCKEEINKLMENISEKQKLMKIMHSELKSLKADGKTVKVSESHDILILENTNLKKEITSFVQHILVIKEKGEDVLNKILENGNKGSLNNNAPSNISSLKDFIQAMQKFCEARHFIWEELKQEYQNLDCKYYSVFDSIDRLKECLSKFVLKTISDSPDYRTLKNLIEALLLSTKQLTEAQERFRDGAKFQNELWTKNFDFERTKSENINFKDQIQHLEKSMKRMEEMKTEAVDYKEKYLKYHENVVLELKNSLQCEYNLLKGRYEEQLKIMTQKFTQAENNYEELVRHKNDLEESYKRINNQNNDLLNVVNENECLTKKIIELNIKNNEMDINYKKALGSMSRSVSTNSISENVDLIEAKEKIKELSCVIEVLRSEVSKITNKYEEEKNIMESEISILQNKLSEKELLMDKQNEEIKGNDISFSQLYDANARFKKLNNEIQQEKEMLKKYYEKQIEDLQMQVDLYNKDMTSNLHSINNCKISQNVIDILNDKIKEKSLIINELKKEKMTIVECHNEETKKLTHSNCEKEQLIKTMKLEWEMQHIEISKTRHEINTEKDKYKKEVESLRDLKVVQNEKYICLKRKYSKMQNEFEKYKSWREEREKYLQNELTRVAKDQFDLNEQQFTGFKEWLIKIRTILADGVSQVIEEMKCIPEKALPFSVLERHIDSLVKVKYAILKLDIREIQENK